MVITDKDGKKHVDLVALFSSKAPVKPGEEGKTAWVVVGYPLFMWPLSLVVLIFGIIAIGWFARQ